MQQGPISRPLAYGSWHPDGVHIVSSANDEYNRSILPVTRAYDFEAVHARGDLVIYNVETNNLSTSGQVFENGYINTQPCWSADGKWIFYIRCRRQPLTAIEEIKKFPFDLMRISYDAASDTWGTPETLMECSKQGKTCAFPRASPDGRYVLCVLRNKASFSAYQKSADLYLFNLESKQWRRLDVLDSDRVDSFPNWSSNGRWITFGSRRRDVITTLPHFAYFDTQGLEHKAFVLPQEDPGYYDRVTDTYNAVQLVNGEVTISQLALAKAVLEQPAIAAGFPNPPKVEAHTGVATRH
jgi:hypothetical protein